MISLPFSGLGYDEPGNVHDGSKCSRTATLTPFAGTLSRKQELELNTKALVWTKLRALNVVKCLSGEIHRLATDAENLTEATTHRNGPAVAAIPIPVRGDDG
jgi:hypothetical protein